MVLINTKQKLHQIKLQQWASRFQEQAPCGLTVKAWYAENNILIHTYNYWKHQLKQEFVVSALSEQSDTDPLTVPASEIAVPKMSYTRLTLLWLTLIWPTKSVGFAYGIILANHRKKRLKINIRRCILLLNCWVKTVPK